MLPVVKGSCDERYSFFVVKGYGKSQLSGIEKQHLTTAAHRENKQYKNSQPNTPAMHIRFPLPKSLRKARQALGV